jgi:hypothetical protein
MSKNTFLVNYLKESQAKLKQKPTKTFAGGGKHTLPKFVLPKAHQ